MNPSLPGLPWAFGALLPLLTSPLSPAVESQVARRSEIYVGFLGDGGTGGKEQKAVARQLQIAREEGKLDSVFLLGDNLYDKGEAKHIRPKYLDVYGELLDEAVPFHAALGNHDVMKCRIRAIASLPRDASAYTDCEVDQQLDPKNRFGYVDGYRYYDVAIPGGAGAPSSGEAPFVQVFVIDTNTLASSQSFLLTGDDRSQLDWLDREVARSRATWKIVVMHHPIHSPASAGWFSGHSREARLGDQLEPILTRHGVDAVFAGHNHFYARMVPQRGVRYFVSGGGGKGMYRYRPDEGYVASDPERGKFHHFIHVRMTPEWFEYCVVDDEGKLRDGGRFRKEDASDQALPDGRCPY
jgi:3',5'-cyclic AMP phosphodiesterase CpdA